jgi:raffinose/stachyose/melibiose transport system substrate-binding protein
MLLAACSGSGTATTQNSSGKVGGQLNLWYTLPTSGSSAEGAAIYKKYSVDPFTKLYPGVTVILSPNNVNTIDAKIQTALAAGGGPDLIPSSGPSNAVAFGAAGYLANLNSAATKYDWKSKILPWALDMGYNKGALETLPTSYESVVLYYNKTLFAKNGWTPPTDRASLETLMSEMDAKGITPFAASNGSYQRNSGHYVTAFLNEVAGPSKVHDALAGTIPWTDPVFESAISLLKTYFQDGDFGGGVKQYFSTQDPQMYAQFASGKAGMYISGSWETYTFPSYFGANGNKDDWGWVPLPPLAPGVPSNIYPLAVGGTMSVNAKSKNIPAATAYLGWLFADTKTMWQSAVATGSEPLPIKFAPSDVPKGIDPRYAAMYKAIDDASEKGTIGYATWTSFGPKEDTYIPEAFDKVINGSLSVAAYCAGIEAAYKADKAANLIPPLFKTGS